MLNWMKGRQGSGYDKALLLGCKWPIWFDVWVLRFPEGSCINSHVDPVDKDYNHFRLNIVVKQAKSGGEFFGTTIWRTVRIVLFRPDLSIHGVTKVEKGTRYVLSIGWLTRRKS